ncbi:hypothetical protein AX14_002654 [Amanita brunnescens Koide BX004]|nr:hypothetical protein AX14_002654 [Amanita brunnescens Koide BX004]
MRSFLCLCILSLAASAFSSPLATETQESSQSFNPYATHSRVHHARSPVSELSQLQDKRLTNAERLAKHYPLRRPHRRSITHQLRSTSAVASNYTTKGYLQVLGEGHRSLGFVAKEYNKYGEYGVLTNDSADYLLVSVDMDEASSRNGVISTVNGPLAAYSFFGAIGGFNSTSNDLGDGSYESGGSCVFCEQC